MVLFVHSQCLMDILCDCAYFSSLPPQALSLGPNPILRALAWELSEAYANCYLQPLVPPKVRDVITSGSLCLPTSLIERVLA